jgi:predicted signal transduction protein with EAL and GGDEF domain
VAVARRLRTALRECDTLARIGGDELALLLPDLAEAEDAGAALRRVLHCFATPFDLGEGAQVEASASIGYTLHPQDPGPGDVLVRHADQAMYAAKRAGKARLLRYDAAQDRVEDLHQVELARIERAFEAGELELHYQPIVDLSDGRVRGAEALLRWHRPELGLIGPARLLRTVAGSELALRIGSWVLREAVRQAQEWRALGLELTVSANLGAEQLRAEGLAAEVRALLGQDTGHGGGPGPGAPAPLLQLEIVETSALEDMTRVARVIGRCRAAGVRIALDDFGTGYSSLTQLRRLPVDTVKIDRSFVRGIRANAEDEAIVAAVTALAQAMGREVVAEGVETESQGRALLALGCRLAQGYGIARPMPAGELPGWIGRWRQERRWGERWGEPGGAAADGRPAGPAAAGD